MTYSHPLRVRYSDVDNQGFVFNSRYLEYVDHAVTSWLRDHGLTYETLRHGDWDFVLRHAECEWLTPARADDLLEMTVDLERMGNSSFVCVCQAHRGDDVCFRMVVTYVSLDPRTGGAARTPDHIRAALSG